MNQHSCLLCLGSNSNRHFHMEEARKALMKLFPNIRFSKEMTTEAIEKIAEGRVWTGATAKELGLVDELGGLDKALEIAAQKANIENYSLINYPDKSNVFSILLEQGKDDYINNQMKETFGEYYEHLKFVQNVKNADRIQARMPFDIRIK